MRRLRTTLKVSRGPSLSQRTADVVKAAIEQGEFQEQLPAERQLASRLKISRGTLRLALEMLKARGLLTVRRKRTFIRTSSRARERTSGNRKVALLLPERLASLSAGMLLQYEDLHRHLQDAGYDLELIESPMALRSRAGGDMREMVRKVAAQTWVLSRCSETVQKFFAREKYRAVVAGHAAEKISLPSVDYDYFAVSRHAAGIFLSRGHRRLVYFGNTHPNAGDLASERGFQQATVQHGSEVRSTFLQLETPEAMARNIARMQKQEMPPTALFVSRPPAVITLICSLATLGLQVGKDVSIICRQADSCLDPILPAISHYRTDFRRLASRIARLVISLNQNPDVTHVPVRLIASYQAGQSVTQLLK